MAKPFIQHSFNSGEWAPHLWARTDIEKYHSGAALLRNFFVDYRGGASTRSGTKYILRGYKDSTAIRLIPFQASLAVKFAMEFGDQYIRFHVGGQPVVETATTITNAVAGPPEVFTDNAHGYSNNNWILVSNNYYIVQNVTANTFTLTDLFGNAINTNPFTLPASAQRVYTLASPYAAADLALLKFVENVNSMIICHPSYVPYILTYSSATSWTLTPIVFGTTISSPANLSLTQIGYGLGVNFYNTYVVTALDINGQESLASTPATIILNNNPLTSTGTVTISWPPVTGAVSYNVYRAIITNITVTPIGAQFGYIGNVTGTSLADANIAADFTQTPPIARNPFATGSKVSSNTITNAGSYTSTPTVTYSPPPAGTTATGTPIFGAISAVVVSGGTSYGVGDTITLSNGVVLTVLTRSGSAVATVSVTNPGSAAPIPSNPVAQAGTSGAGTGATFTVTWGATSIAIINGGDGYITAPTVTFSAGAATATCTISPASNGNPSVPTFFQQRLCLGGPPLSPQTVNMSQPGLYFNFNISSPVQDDDAIGATIVSGFLNNIKAMVPQPGGLILLTDGSSFLVSGGSLGSAVTPTTITSNAQSFLGCNDMPPIVVNYDVLYVQSKGSSVRDASYNFYANVFTGSDISVLSSHLFFGYQLLEWAWCEEPYKIVWAVRNDGDLLSLTFVKEQEFIGWAHHDTNGSFKSVCSIVEAASVGYQNYLYTVVQRSVQGQTVQYIEYMPERATSNVAADYWTVDAGLQYNGAPATSFSGAQHLGGLTCTGLADGTIIPAFTMPTSGSFTLSTPASKVTVGLAFTPQLQTLFIDLGQPTVQSKMKKIPEVTIRVTETLGLTIGSDSSNLVPMKDLTVGNVGSMTNEPVTDLVTGDARTIIDPKWQEAGQFFIEQPYPYPASILGVIPEVAVGDTEK